MNFDDLVITAEKNAADLEPWNRYYRLRAKEMESLFSFYVPDKRGIALDIGSGLGFNALMLDRIYEKTIAADLYKEDPATHTLGTDKARRFLEVMPHRSIQIVSCPGEKLPFRSESFDAVFSIYTMEHMRDRVSAMSEIRRVLKMDGEAVIVVPGFLERLFYPLSFYRAIFKSAFFRAFRDSDSEAFAQRAVRCAKRAPFRNHYPHFPFPEPHGNYPDFFTELAQSTPFIWTALARRSGFKIKSVFTTMLFPKELFSIMIGRAALGAYIKTVRINGSLGNKVLLKYLGQNLCLVLGKDA